MRVTHNNIQTQLGQYSLGQYALEIKRKADIIIAQNLPQEVITAQLKNLSKTHNPPPTRRRTKPATKRYPATLTHGVITYHLGDFKTKSDAQSAEVLARDLLLRTTDKSPENLMQAFDAIRQMGIKPPAKSTRTHKNEYDPLNTLTVRSATGIKGLYIPREFAGYSKDELYQLYITLSHNDRINGGFYETLKEGTAAAFYVRNLLNEGKTADEIQERMLKPQTLQDMAVKLAKNQFRAIGICKNDTDGKKMQIASPRIDTILPDDFNNIHLQEAMKYEIIVLYNVKAQELQNPDLYISQIFEITDKED